MGIGNFTRKLTMITSISPDGKKVKNKTPFQMTTGRPSVSDQDPMKNNEGCNQYTVYYSIINLCLSRFQAVGKVKDTRGIHDKKQCIERNPKRRSTKIDVACVYCI